MAATTSLEAMLALVKGRTKYLSNDTYLIQELNDGLAQAWKRIYPACSDLQIMFETTGTLAVETQEFDLAAVITLAGGEFFAHKTFYVYDAGSLKYIPVVFMDANDPRFLDREQMTAQVLQPCYAAAVNFGEVRFAPALPSGSQWRSDWVGNPPKMSLAAQVYTTLPEPFAQPIVSWACANVFSTMDDTREDGIRDRFEDQCLAAVHQLKRRQNQTPQRTAPFPRSGGGGRMFPANQG